jgi:integrase
MDALNDVIKLGRSGNDLLTVNLKKSNERPFNSVATLTAQCATLLQQDSKFESLFSVVNSIVNGEGNHPDFVRAAVELQFLNGLRISEVLGIKGVDISSTSHIKITTSKVVSHRLCVTSRYSHFWQRFRGRNVYVFQDYSRFWFYRYYRAHGLTMRFSNSPNSAVTHLFRHLLISQNVENTDDLATLKSFVAHKSIKSTKHYANKK